MTLQNIFLHFGGVPRPEPPRRLYALLDQADVLEDGRTRLLFDSVDAGWFDANGIVKFRDGPASSPETDYFSNSPVFVLQWDVNPFALPSDLAGLLEKPPTSHDDNEWLRSLGRQWIEV